MIALGASAAGAHVAVVPGSAPKGGFEVLSFNVPNEEENANTVKVEVNLPTKYPIASVSLQPMPGWTSTVEKTKLSKPVKTDDGDVTEAVTKITWTATDGGLTPGQFDLFTISAGPLPTNTSQAGVQGDPDLQRRHHRQLDPADGEGGPGTRAPGARAEADCREHRPPVAEPHRPHEDAWPAGAC